MIFIQGSSWKFADDIMPRRALKYFIAGENVPHYRRNLFRSNSDSTLIMNKVYPEGNPVTCRVESIYSPYNNIRIRFLNRLHH